MALVVGLIVGAGLAGAVQWRELGYLRKELAIAQDRLLHAWRDDKALIPPRPREPDPPPPPLPPELMDLVQEWESQEARDAMEKKLRGLYFDRGWGIKAILRDAENTHPA